MMMGISIFRCNSNILCYSFYYINLFIIFYIIWFSFPFFSIIFNNFMLILRILRKNWKKLKSEKNNFFLLIVSKIIFDNIWIRWWKLFINEFLKLHLIWRVLLEFNSCREKGKKNKIKRIFIIKRSTPNIKNRKFISIK